MSVCAGCGNADINESGLCPDCRNGLMRQGLSYQVRPRTVGPELIEEDSVMNQEKKVLRHLETFGSIDPIQAMQEYGILRLAARINDLRQKHDIETHLVKTVNRFGEEVRYGRYVLARR